MKTPNEIQFGNLTLADFGKNLIKCGDFLIALSDAISNGELGREDKSMALVLTATPLLALHSAEEAFQKIVSQEIDEMKSEIKEKRAREEMDSRPEGKGFSIIFPANGIKS